MQKLMQNRKKGFTLVELIVVIVIIAILMAALTPAILGVINRANRSADEANARSVMLAAGVAATLVNPPSPPLGTGTSGANNNGVANMNHAFGGAGMGPRRDAPVTYHVWFRGPSAIRVSVPARSATQPTIVIGELTAPTPGSNDIVLRAITINAQGNVTYVGNVVNNPTEIN